MTVIIVFINKIFAFTSIYSTLAAAVQNVFKLEVFILNFTELLSKIIIIFNLSL